MESSMTTATSTNNHCWIQRDFLKEKLRVKERYWHSLVPPSRESQQQQQQQQQESTSKTKSTETGVVTATNWIVIPDASAWRKYLSLIIYLIERQREQQQQQVAPSSSSSCLQWLLLESVAEWMDYRNMSASISSDDDVVVPPEAVTPQERSKLLKLLKQQQEQQQQHKRQIGTFCDLSVRSEPYEDDEWAMMQYDTLSVPKRCQNALFRAARLVLEQHHEKKDNTTNDGPDDGATDASSLTRVVIVSGDADFVRQFPIEDEVRTMSMRDLLLSGTILRCFPDPTSALLDHVMPLVERCEQEYDQRNEPSSAVVTTAGDGNEAGVIEYWNDDLIQAGLRNKTLIQGRLTVSKENPKEGAVKDSNGNSYFINQQPPHGNFNRAIHNDMVVIRILPQQEWSSPVGRRRLLVPIRNDGNDGYEPDIDAVNDRGNDSPVPTGRVVAITRESRRSFVATMIDTPLSDESSCLVVPMDVRIPKIRIKTSSWQRFVGNRLWVQIDGWEIGSNYPSGHCMDILGPIADLETEITCLLKENQVYLEPFSVAAKACLPIQGHDWQIPATEISRRRDLRSLSIFSVDPVGCQDIDDTMHARVLSNGDIEIGVHIADVTYFVDHNTALDREAQARATTFYLVDRRFDMLPSVLSSDLCSLHGNMDRLAVSTIWTFSSDFQHVKDFWYGRSVIHNVQAMTYEQAHNILSDVPPDSPLDPPTPPLTAGYPVNRGIIKSLKNNLILLTDLARILRRNRENFGGAVDLSSGDQGSELKFSLDSQGNPVRVVPKKEMEIHHTIAELMILANTYVAKTIFDRFPESALLRIHQSVDESRFEDLKEVLHAGNIQFDGSSNMKLADSLKTAERKTNAAVSSLFQSLATRAMSEAKYVSTGEEKGEMGLSHYGLGLKTYTHFTSPIRRYADVVVHRQLLLTLIPKSIIYPAVIGREDLPSLPESEMISILHGEGLRTTAFREFSRDDVVPSKGEKPVVENVVTMPADTIDSDLYSNQVVSRICDNLNHQNRMAKLSSYECQRLFLSLYFKDRFEVTRAVVTNLRANGFFAYVPRFDFRAPVYLSDKNGELQIDPGLLRLPASAGQPPTAGFASSHRARKFPSGRCVLKGSSENEVLELSTSDSPTTCSLKVLDVVTVAIASDDWDTKSRIPQPKIYLIADTSKEASASVAFSSVSNEARNHSNDAGPAIPQVKQGVDPLSMYQELLRIKTPSTLRVSYRTNNNISVPTKIRATTMPGRMVYGGFVNPDTRSAKQEAAVKQASEAAIERRNQLLATRAKQDEFGVTNRIEKEVTARMQRLAVNKRNARIKGKGK